MLVKIVMDYPVQDRNDDSLDAIALHEDRFYCISYFQEDQPAPFMVEVPELKESWEMPHDRVLEELDRFEWRIWGQQWDWLEEVGLI